MSRDLFGKRPAARTSGRSDLVDIAGELRHETFPDDPDQGAFLIFDGSREVWVPKSLVQHDPDEKTFAMPEWLAQDKGLI